MSLLSQSIFQKFRAMSVAVQVQALAWLILAVLVTWDSAALFSLTTTDGALSPSACGVNGALQLWWLLLSGYYLSCGIVQVAGRCAMRRRSPSHA